MGTSRYSIIFNIIYSLTQLNFSRILGGVEAERIGLVNHCVPQSDTGDAAYKKALQIAQGIKDMENSLLIKMCNTSVG